jgi:large subunit ribosomal protein L13
MPEVMVVVKNADLIAVTGNKESQKTYYNFSGYPGGLKRESLRHLRGRNPEKILYQAVSRMLPKNRLRPRFLKRLKLELSSKA